MNVKEKLVARFARASGMDDHPWMQLEDRMVAQNDHYPVTVPNGTHGDWRIDEFVIGDNDIGPSLSNLRSIRDGIPEHVVSPGRYKRLTHKQHGVVMSNTQFEYRTNCSFVGRATGTVLITGLGLGMIIKPLLAKKAVQSLTVVEVDRDLIDMVGPHYADARLRIVCADAYTWKPDMFDCAWHDIWSDFGESILPEHRKIKAHYRLHVTRFQECWAAELSRRMARR